METAARVEFDEDWYLQENEDVARAVAKGTWACGHSQYLAAGKAGGKCGLPLVKEDWYLKTYPMALEEVKAGKAHDVVEHYLRLGRHRGYLPNPTTRRPGNPASFRSKFGGLWIDQANALDIVAGRLELGTIDAVQAALLTKWIRDGYVVLQDAIDDETLERATHDFDKGYDGKISQLRFSVHGVGRQLPWVPEVKTNPTKALDIHWFSPAIRDLIFAPKLLEFLHLIFERRALASQTLGFLRGSGQDAHQDSAYVNYSLPMQFVASWVALEDVAPGAGELFYYVGSQRMPEFFYLGEFKGVEEARRMGVDQNLDAEIKAHITNIVRLAEGMQLSKECLMAKRGDVLFWSADLAHGGSPISKDRTRKSVVTHYCPAEVIPTYFEHRPNVAMRSHGGKAYFTTRLYAGIDVE
jgi:hypothetical protein